MGTSSSLPSLPDPYETPVKDTLRIERILASGCDYLPPNQSEDTIRVGILGRSDPNNPLSHQAIRIGDSEPYRLQACQQTHESITFSFEKNVNLTLMKRRGSFVYNLKTPELNVTREIYPGIVKMFKPIGMVSEELDKIKILFHHVA